MKPTQQEIIELAREANMTVLPDETLWWAVHQDELERFATLLLERFGAGGGEPVAFVHWPLSGAPRLAWYGYKALNAAILKAYEGHQPDMLLYTHHSPTDLRAEYERGLDDAADICDRFQHRDVGMQPAECASAIRALKGKQWTFT